MACTDAPISAEAETESDSEETSAPPLSPPTPDMESPEEPSSTQDSVGDEGCGADCECDIARPCAEGESCEDGICVDLEFCGNGEIEGEEECDLGQFNADQGLCTSSCRLQVCGDRHVGPGEACDDGPEGSDACRPDCVLAQCGDGVVQAGEECDDANADDSDACRSTCVEAFCGDGIVQVGVEECDDSDSGECLEDCRLAIPSSCGNGQVEAGELCYGPVVRTAFSSIRRPVDVEIADFDADGHLDLALLWESATTLTFMRGVGDGSFEPGEEFYFRDVASRYRAHSLEAVALNPDGRPDLVVLGGDGKATEIFRILSQDNEEDGGDWVVDSRRYAGANPGQISLGAFGGGESRYLVSLIPRIEDGGATLAPENGPTISTTIEGGSVLATGDINGDGVAELVAASPLTSELMVFDNTLTERRRMDVDFPHRLLIADLDDDGRAEILATEWDRNNCDYGASASDCGPGRVLIVRGREQLEALDRGEIWLVDGAPDQIAAGDFNADGRMDVVTLAAVAQSFSFLEQGDDGTMNPGRRVSLARDGGPSAFAIGDLNEDGAADLVSTHYDNHALHTVISNP